MPRVWVIAIFIRRQPSELLRGLAKEPSCELYSLDAKLKLDREKTGFSVSFGPMLRCSPNRARAVRMATSVDSTSCRSRLGEL